MKRRYLQGGIREEAAFRNPMSGVFSLSGPCLPLAFLWEELWTRCLEGVVGGSFLRT